MVRSAPIQSAALPAIQRTPARPVGTPGAGKAQRLADATGATREVDPSGRSTVVFRVPDELGSPEGAAAAPPAATASARPVAIPGPGDPEGIDDLYDRLLDRLRRDLLVERERSPGLSFDLY
ncbi:MAG TPA: hypothetical protein VG165_07990 [Solirubrobacteraceae bacterium]|nr:hypothetical protein [Solirubrobacteraceae bacterium]